MADKGKILVVDDDRLVLATVTHGLAQAGYQVLDADNGDDAILLARQHRPDLALLDIRMEGLSGFDVAAYLRDQLHVPFMFLSAFADEDTVRQVKDLGAVAYLVKPLDIGQILPTVAAAFGQLPARAARAAEAAAGQGAASSAAPQGLQGGLTGGPAAGGAMGGANGAAKGVAKGGALGGAIGATIGMEAPPRSIGQNSQPNPTAIVSDLVPMAIGVLMHRYSLQRGQAADRLQRLAREEGRSLADQAERLVEAVELLARGQG